MIQRRTFLRCDLFGILGSKGYKIAWRGCQYLHCGERAKGDVSGAVGRSVEAPGGMVGVGMGSSYPSCPLDPPMEKYALNMTERPKIVHSVGALEVSQFGCLLHLHGLPLS